MKTLKIFIALLIFAFAIGLQNSYAQSRPISPLSDSLVIITDINFDYDAEAEKEHILLDIPDRSGRKISLDLVNADIQNVFLIEATGNKVQLVTSDGKTFLPDPKTRNTPNVELILDLNHNSGSSAAVGSIGGGAPAGKATFKDLN
ncbi:MAG: hypothetical protein AAF502_12785 [Bacteroidota bacterium]